MYVAFRIVIPIPEAFGRRISSLVREIVTSSRMLPGLLAMTVLKESLKLGIKFSYLEAKSQGYPDLHFGYS